MANPHLDEGTSTGTTQPMKMSGAAAPAAPLRRASPSASPRIHCRAIEGLSPANVAIWNAAHGTRSSPRDRDRSQATCEVDAQRAPEQGFTIEVTEHEHRRR